VNQELGTTTAVITHNAAIARMAHRVVMMRSGEVVRVEHNTHKLAPEELEW
jgi:putative ABC transport system ATP-binding protein